MSKIGYGYGSECHLLRWMGRHRNEFNRRVFASLKPPPHMAIEWLDWAFRPRAPWPDAELKGLEFLTDRPDVQRRWAGFWPQTRGIHNWDAVAWLCAGDRRELVLVEAKAHLGEISSRCRATDPNSLRQIRQALQETKEYLDVADGAHDWMRHDYQVANRLAVLYFLTKKLPKKARIPAKLLFIYFTGDRTRPGVVCPKDEQEWQQALSRQAQRLGLPEEHQLVERVFKLFLPVAIDARRGT